MTSVTIFGSGNMGTAIDSVLSAGGASVDHIGSADPPGPVNGDIVILAVYYAALQDILADYADKFAGKTVVDISNPVNVETFDSLLVPADSSSAEELAAALPSSRVLKAFNTTFASALSAKISTGLACMSSAPMAAGTNTSRIVRMFIESGWWHSPAWLRRGPARGERRRTRRSRSADDWR